MGRRSPRIDQELLPQLTLVFNIDHTNAMAYATAADSLLSGPVRQAL